MGLWDAVTSFLDGKAPSLKLNVLNGNTRGNSNDDKRKVKIGGKKNEKKLQKNKQSQVLNDDSSLHLDDSPISYVDN